MNESDTKRTLHRILTHRSPVVWGEVTEEVRELLSSLRSDGDAMVPQLLSAVTMCAAGSLGGYPWWDGAQELCKLLAQINTSTAKSTLLTILKTDSNIVEFDRVRAEAAIQLSGFRDPGLVSELLLCLEMPHAPILAIKKAIETLGGQPPASPDVIIEEGRNINDPQKAIQHFSRYEHEVSKWPKKKQGGYYFFFGCRVERAKGIDAALPYFAASLLANPGPNAVAWQYFDVEPSPENAKRLSEKYPLTKSQQFEGKSVEQAKAVAIAAIPSGKIVSLEVARDVQGKTAEGEGKSANEAIETAKAHVLSEAFDISTGKITQNGQNGTVEVQAYSEIEARQQITWKAPEGACLENLECILAPKKGFLGIGRKQGTWRARWSIPFKAQISFKVPAVVTVRFNP